MKKIGLCLAFNGTNYGQNLQAFATQKMIQKLGFETEIIDYHSERDKGIKWSPQVVYFIGMTVVKSLRRELKRNDEVLDEIHRQNVIERRETSSKFRTEYLNSIVRVNGYRALKEKSKEYLAVLVGSDQIWTPATAFTQFYTLRFAEPGVTRISYATSLGVSEYPNYAKKEAADFWKKIDYLSVREEQGKKIIKSIVDVPVEVVVDPTYLFTKDEWDTLIPKQNIVESGYVFCYFLGDNPKAKKQAVRYAKKNGLRIVGVLSNECNADDSSYDEILTGKGPDDFVNLIRNAECVFTDSFHGLAFSVINSIPFYIYYRIRKEVKVQRNSRIDNILAVWGLEERLIKDLDSAVEKKDIDYARVQDIVRQKRNKSLIFLDNALKGCKEG